MITSVKSPLIHYVTRDYQRDLVANAIERTLSPRRKYNNLALIGATGCGKTVVSALLSVAALRISNPGKNADVDPHAWTYDPQGRQVLFIVDQKNLIKQTAKTFKNIIKSRIVYDSRTAERGLEDSITIIQGNNKYESHKSIVIASRQTLTNCYAELVDKGLLRPYVVIFDECHSTQYCDTGRFIRDYQVPVGGGRWDFPYFARFGLTATPYYPGRDWFGMDWDQAQVSLSHGDLIQQGALIPYRYYQYGGIELQEGIKANKYGNFREKDAHLKFGSDHRIEFALEEWERITQRSPFEKAITFPINIEHGQRIVDIANDRGHKFELITYKTPDKEREKIVERYKETLDTNGLVAVRALQKGFDAPCVSSILDLAPTKSDTSHIQKYGRGARPFAGNAVLPALTHCKIFDFVGNVASLDLKGKGRPDLIVLTEKIVLGNEPFPLTYTAQAPTKMCTACGAENFTSATTCSKCGEKFLFKDPAPETLLKGRMIEVISPKTVNNNGRAIAYFRSLRSTNFLTGYDPDKAAYEYRENVELHGLFPLPRHKTFPDDKTVVSINEKQDYRHWCAGGIMGNENSDEMAQLMMKMIAEKDPNKWVPGLINRVLKLEFTDEIYNKYKVEDAKAFNKEEKEQKARDATEQALDEMLKRRGAALSA